MSPTRVKRSSRTATMVLATMFAASACAGTVAASGEATVGPAGQADSHTSSNTAGTGPDASVLDGIEAVDPELTDVAGEADDETTDAGYEDDGQPEGPSDPDGNDSDDDTGTDPDEDHDDDDAPDHEGDDDQDDDDQHDDDEEVEEPTIPGSPLDFGPEAGTSLSVVGVRYDDRLNFRVDPSPSASILDTAAPLGGKNIVALGEAWQAPSGVWWKVAIDGQEAWANQRFLGSPIAGVERFPQVSSELASVEFETLADAAQAVAATRASTEPKSRVVLASEPLLFEEGGRAIVDVLDLGDDAVKGERLDITVETIYDESGPEGAQDVLGVRVTSVRIIPICGRGVSGGLCS